MRLHYLSIWLGALLLSMPLFAQTNYVLTTSSPSTVLDTCGRHGLTIVVIDTGVDPKHPALSSVLTTGFDFTRNQPGVPSELADLAPALQPGLTQSVTPILESQTVVPVNNSTLAILDQSVTPILEG